MNLSVVERVLHLAAEIQQIPAPTFDESRRSRFIRGRFVEAGLSEVRQDEAGNVYACLPGRGETLPLVVSAHIDTVFPAGMALPIGFFEDQITGPGIGDNALGVAGLLGLVWSLEERGLDLPGDLWLAANVGEEGLGNLRGMRTIVERFGKEVLAYLVVEGLALGQIYHRGLSVQRYRVSVHTQGGHAWVDFGRTSAINILAGLIQRLAALPLPDQPRTTLNVGVISGGTSINTIASSAQMEVDLRSEDEGVLNELVARAMTVTQDVDQEGVRVQVEMIGQRPAGEIPAEHPLVRLAVQCLREQGLEAHLSIGSTDANLPLSLGLPAVCIGLSSGGGAHTTEEHMQKAPLVQGINQLICLVEGAYRVLPDG